DANWIVTDQVSGRRVLTSAAFQPDDDGVSVYLHSVLSAGGLKPKDVTNSPLNAVAALAAWVPRAHELGIRRDPWPADIIDPEHPRNAAHALIVGWNNFSNKARHRIRRELSQAATLIIDPGAAD